MDRLASEDVILKSLEDFVDVIEQMDYRTGVFLLEVVYPKHRRLWVETRFSLAMGGEGRDRSSKDSMV